MIIIQVISIAFWAILGLLFLMPLLFRIIAAFCCIIVFSMVVNNPGAIRKSKLSLDLARVIKPFDQFLKEPANQSITPLLYSKIISPMENMF